MVVVSGVATVIRYSFLNFEEVWVILKFVFGVSVVHGDFGVDPGFQFAVGVLLISFDFVLHHDDFEAHATELHSVPNPNFVALKLLLQELYSLTEVPMVVDVFNYLPRLLRWV